ncbi:MAG TPA: tripartite tricarboxylate transporter substrate binding protein [Burkholderiales bacterium]|nr:tripartite tricarboxylate transporter substrate binding protein [Burkholderiales bacterium]
MRAVLRAALAAILVVALPAPAQTPSASSGQAYPSRPVRMIVPFPAGGPADLVARLLGSKLPETWGQPLVIENRGGAGGNIGTAAAARAAADGYTLLLTTSGLMSNPSLYKDPGFDPVRDFAPVTVVGNSATIVVRHPSLAGVNTMRDIEALARTTKVDFATPGIGLAGHLAGELFKTMTKVDMQAIPFAGAAPAITAVLAGQVKLGFMAVPSTVPHVKSGKLVAIAVTSPKRLAVLPGVPTVAESGYPGFQVDNMYGVLAPRGTPPETVKKLHDDIVRAVRAPDATKTLEAATIDVVLDTPEEFAAYIRSETAKWAQVVKDSGAKVE